MGIEYKRNQAYFKDMVTADDAEPFLDWLQKQKKAKISLSKVSHIHTAVLQVLMAGDFVIQSWPKDNSLLNWLTEALKENKK